LTGRSSLHGDASVATPVGDDRTVYVERRRRTSTLRDVREDELSDEDVALAYALEYARKNWHVLWLAVDGPGGKIPPANCAECSWKSRGAAAYHDPATCGHLLCHGFHAASTDPDRIRAARAALPGGALAIRTGRISNLLVLDFEAYALNDEDPNDDAVESWETLTDTEPLPPTVRARSVSGGLHLYFSIPCECDVALASRRVLDGVDVKCESGYVGAPRGDGRRTWVPQFTRLLDAPPALLDYLTARREPAAGGLGGPDDASDASGDRRALGRAAGRPSDYDFTRYAREGCPGGSRDYFFNELVFRTVKRGVGDDTYRVAREHWERCAQPPNARWYMPWEHVEYKVRRALAQVRPDPPDGGVPESLREWARGAGRQVSRHGVARVTLKSDADGATE